MNFCKKVIWSNIPSVCWIRKGISSKMKRYIKTTETAISPPPTSVIIISSQSEIEKVRRAKTEKSQIIIHDIIEDIWYTEKILAHFFCACHERLRIWTTIVLRCHFAFRDASLSPTALQSPSWIYKKKFLYTLHVTAQHFSGYGQPKHTLLLFLLDVTGQSNTWVCHVETGWIVQRKLASSTRAWG